MIRVSGSLGGVTPFPFLTTYSTINAPFHKMAANTAVNTAEPTHP